MFQDIMQKVLRHKTVFAALNILLGIYLIITGRGSLYTAIRVAGTALLVAAAVYLALYFIRSRQDPMHLYYAGAACVAGLAVRWLAPALVSLFPVLAGIALIVIGISNLTSVSGSNVFPAYSKLGPILTIVLGALILFHPGRVLDLAVTLAGAALILNGLSELDLIRRIW